MSFWQSLLAILIVLLCGFLILVILLQRGRGGGLAGAFGGGGGSGAFGAKTGDVFTWITVVVASLFVVMCIAANFLFDQSAVAVQETASTTGTVDTQEVPIELLDAVPVTTEEGAEGSPDEPIKIELVPAEESTSPQDSESPKPPDSKESADGSAGAPVPSDAAKDEEKDKNSDSGEGDGVQDETGNDPGGP